jgi:hypothetical protein
MRELFECIFLHAEKYGTDSTFTKMVESGACKQKLQMSTLKLRELLKGAIKIGGLLHTKTVESQTIVGDANVAALARARQAHIVGHSFGLLVHANEYMMVENTVWQRRFLEDVDRKFSQNEVAFMRAFVGRGFGRRMAGVTTKPLEQKIYLKLYLGHDKLYFSKERREYGITLDELQRGAYAAMTMRQVLQELAKSENFFGCPAKPEALPMLALYEQIEADLPSIWHAVMTPQKSESEFEKLMENWEPIYEMTCWLSPVWAAFGAASTRTRGPRSSQSCSSVSRWGSRPDSTTSFTRALSTSWTMATKLKVLGAHLRVHHALKVAPRVRAAGFEVRHVAGGGLRIRRLHAGPLGRRGHRPRGLRLERRVARGHERLDGLPPARCTS